LPAHYEMPRVAIYQSHYETRVAVYQSHYETRVAIYQSHVGNVCWQSGKVRT